MLKPPGPDFPLLLAVEVHIEFEVPEESGKELVHLRDGDVFADADLSRGWSVNNYLVGYLSMQTSKPLPLNPRRCFESRSSCTRVMQCNVKGR
jgi:hypothetical protein